MARAFLAEHSGSEQVRAAMTTERGFDEGVWKQIGAELGMTAVLVPEAYGGLGLGFVELVALMETMGEALLCAPFLSSVCLGGSAILACANEAQKQAWLPGLADGTLRATLAVAETSGRWDAAGIETRYREEGSGFVLSGVKRYVVDGHSADLVIVAARREGSEGESGIGLFAVPGEAAGLVRKRLSSMDQTRRLAELALDDVQVGSDACLGEAGNAWPTLERALQQSAVALAAEQLGGAQRCLEMAVAYAKERVQFGRPIGSFQAIKHKCADMMVRAEAARSAVYYAGCVADEDAARLPEAACTAKAVASDAYFRNAGEALQIFGGVGFTWEYDVHLYLKRARSSASLLGDAAWHREQLARRIGL